MRAIYSFNKSGFEERYWLRELEYQRGDDQIIPFNHGPFVEFGQVHRAQLLDKLYHAQESRLMSLYARVESLIKETKANCLVVDNVMPYHPEFLRKLKVYKVLRTSDGPISAYDRDFAYLHAYDHILYHSPAYSRDLDMAQKLAYVGARCTHLWPLALFDEMFDPAKSEEQLFAQERDIDVIFVGALFLNKMPLLARVKKALGRRFVLRGRADLKSKVYFNIKFGFPGWVSPISFEQYVPLYQRTKIGINVHNRGKYTVGGYRLFDLPGNGVMQISDGEEYLESFFEDGVEIVGYRDFDDLIDKVRYYLDRPEERERVARAGYRRVMADHRIRTRLDRLTDLLNAALAEATPRNGEAGTGGISPGARKARS